MNEEQELCRELLYQELGRFIIEQFQETKFYYEEVIQQKSVQALAQIRAVIQDETYSDFDAVEEIVCIFEQYGISAEDRHDFG